MAYQGLLSKVREAMVGSYAGKFLTGAALAIGMAATARADTAVKYTADANIRIMGSQTDMYYGCAIAKGDVNGDGIQDAIIGGYNTIGIFYGNSNWNERMTSQNRYSSGAQGPDVQIVGDIFGGDPAFHAQVITNAYALSTGDLNGDGKDEIIIGNPLETVIDATYGDRANAGVVRVVKGSSTLPAIMNLTDSADPNYHQPDLTVYGADIGDNLGFVTRTGDVADSSGIDLIISAYNGDGNGNAHTDAGEAYVFVNRSLDNHDTINLVSGAGQSADYAIYGKDNGDWFGTTMSIGNIGGSSRADLLIGAAGDGANDTLPYAGEVYAFTSLAGTPPVIIDLASGGSADTTIYGGASSDHQKFSKTCDINGDGNNDLILSAVGPGKVFVLYGPISQSVIDFATTTPDVTITGVDGVSGFGSVVECGDVNKDKSNGHTLEDLVVNSQQENGQNDSTLGGGTHVLYGRTNWPANFSITNDHASVTIRGTDAMQQYGQTVTIGDFDGDGFTDILGAAMNTNFPNTPAGNVYLTLSPRMGNFTKPGGSDYWTLVGSNFIVGHEFIPSVFKWDYYEYDINNMSDPPVTDCCNPNTENTNFPGTVRGVFENARTGSMAYLVVGVNSDRVEFSRGLRCTDAGDCTEIPPPANACVLDGTNCP